MTIVSRTSDQVLQGMLNQLVAITSINVTSPGSVARSLYEIIAEEIAYDYRLFDINTSQLFLSTAGGTALDRLGTLFGVTRKSTLTQIGTSTGTVYFYLNTNTTHANGVSDVYATVDITIPAGTMISTAMLSTDQNPITWKTMTDTTIVTGEYMAFAAVTPLSYETYTVAEGSVKYHNLDPVLFPNVYVYNRADLEAKPEVESDTNYRFRIASSVRLAATGNALAIRLACLAVTGVRDCVVTPFKYGVGTVGVAIVLEDPASTSASGWFSAAAVKAEETRSAGDLIFVTRPTESVVDITVSMLMKDGSSASNLVKTAAASAIKRYLNTLSVGDPVIYSRIITEAMSISPQIRDIVIIDGGMKVNAVAVVRGNIPAKTDEQFFPGTISAM